MHAAARLLVTHRAIEHGLHRFKQVARIVRVSRLLVWLLRRRTLRRLRVGRCGLLLRRRRLGSGCHGEL